MGVAVVGLKLGSEGLYLRTTSDAARLEGLESCGLSDPKAWRSRELLAPCFEVEVEGTTGSGDCTIAGFLAGLSQSQGPEAAVTSAVAVGACNVEKADATSGIRSWTEVQARIRSGWPRRPMGVALDGWQWEAGSAVWRGPSDGR